MSNSICGWNETVIRVSRSNLSLHTALEQACERAKEGEFVPAIFVQIMMQKQLDQISELELELDKENQKHNE